MTTKATAKKRIIIEAICEKCAGTGIMPARPFFPIYMRKKLKDKGVVCFYCGGTGRRIIEYRPFKRRKRRAGVKTVVKSRIIRGGTGDGFVDVIALDEKSCVDYEDFFRRRKLPK